jgi:KTSC domain-containing protein
VKKRRRRPAIRLLLVPDSTNIHAVGYDRDRRALRVDFRDGSKYEYADVSPTTYTVLVGAASIGVHFATHIRGKYVTKCIKRPRARAHAS